MKDFTFIILAGGKSSRMGTEKGLLPLNNKPLIQYTLDVVKHLSENIIIVANNKLYEQFGYKVIPDKYENKGPLAGIYSGLLHSSTSKNIILTCDSPFITEELLQLLIQNSFDNEFVYPIFESKIYPLTAFYHKLSLNKIKIELENNRLKVKDLLNILKSKEIVLSQHFSKAMINVNTLEDLKKIA